MKAKLIFLIAILVTVLPFALFFGPIILNYNKTAKNTFILEKNYSGLNREEIVSRLQTDWQLPENIILKTSQKSYPISLDSVSAQVNHNKVASTILYRRLNEGVLPYIRYFFKPKNFFLEISYDDSRLNQALADIAAQTDKPFVPSQLVLSGTSVTIKPGQIGSRLDTKETKEMLTAALSSWSFQDGLELPVKSEGSLPDDAQAVAAQSRAQKLIGKHLLLKSDLGNMTLDDKTIISWLSFDGSYSQSALEDYTNSLSTSIKRDPVNAVFRFENGKVLEFQPAKEGITVDQSNLVPALKSSLGQLEGTSDKSLTLDIPVTKTEPLVKTEDVNDLGIKDLLGRGTSTFKHSAAIRNHNIEKGASIVNQILVAPGETFSFIKSLGEVTLEAGYKQAYVIKKGQTVLDVGGGVCQVSTTLFRAMLNSGVNITDRKNHAYRVSYYEEDMPPGYDATVFIPNPDLKFINDTGHYILIQNTYDGKNKVLTYELYGTSDGRKAEITNYRQWGAAPAPPAVYIDDPTLPQGKVVQDEKAIPGLKTAFDWKVTKNGEVLHEKTFQSNFVPWAAVYRRGPGTPTP